MYVVVDSNNKLIFKSSSIWQAKSVACDISEKEKASIQRNDGSHVLSYLEGKPIFKKVDLN